MSENVDTSSLLYKYYWKPYFWSRSYCLISTGGASIDIIKKIYSKSKKIHLLTNSSPPKFHRNYRWRILCYFVLKKLKFNKFTDDGAD
nr:transposase [Borreliella bavariensis]